MEVLDPTCCVGTTGVAVIKAGARFTGIELDAARVEIAKRRCSEAEREADEAKALKDATVAATGETTTEPQPEKTPEFYREAGRELHNAAQTNLQLKTILQSLANPKSDLGGMTSSAPGTSVAPFLKGKKVPKGIETLGDLQQAALHGRRPPTGKGKTRKG